MRRDDVFLWNDGTDFCQPIRRDLLYQAGKGLSGGDRTEHGGNGRSGGNHEDDHARREGQHRGGCNSAEGEDIDNQSRKCRRHHGVRRPVHGILSLPGIRLGAIQIRMGDVQPGLLCRVVCRPVVLRKILGSMVL